MPFSGESVRRRSRELREQKQLSQGDIERRAGLLRCYISRVENGHTIPAVETLEKSARALEAPMYQFFYDGAEVPSLQNPPKPKTVEDIVWGNSGKDAKLLATVGNFFATALAVLRSATENCSYF